MASKSIASCGKAALDKVGMQRVQRQRDTSNRKQAGILEAQAASHLGVSDDEGAREERLKKERVVS